MRNEYRKVIEKIHEKNDKVVSILADSITSGMDSVRNKYPNRFIECGIAECNAVGVAAGIAASGGIPILYAPSAFLVYRAFEFIRDDVCIQSLNVKIVGYGAGVSFNNFGVTHHATEDIGLMRSLPNLKILSVNSPREVEPIIECAVEIEGPVYVRFGKAFEEEIYVGDSTFKYGKGTLLREGNDLAIISTGAISSGALKAAKLLDQEGIHPRLIVISTIKPIDKDIILKAAIETGKLLVVEEHSTVNGLAGAIEEILAMNRLNVIYDKVGLNDKFCEDFGWYQDIKKLNGLDEDNIYLKAKKMMKSIS